MKHVVAFSSGMITLYVLQTGDGGAEGNSTALRAEDAMEVIGESLSAGAERFVARSCTITLVVVLGHEVGGWLSQALTGFDSGVVCVSCCHRCTMEKEKACRVSWWNISEEPCNQNKNEPSGKPMEDR